MFDILAALNYNVLYEAGCQARNAYRREVKDDNDNLVTPFVSIRCKNYLDNLFWRSYPIFTTTDTFLEDLSVESCRLSGYRP